MKMETKLTHRWALLKNHNNSTPNLQIFYWFGWSIHPNSNLRSKSTNRALYVPSDQNYQIINHSSEDHQTRYLVKSNHPPYFYTPHTNTFICTCISMNSQILRTIRLHLKCVFSESGDRYWVLITCSIWEKIWKIEKERERGKQTMAVPWGSTLWMAKMVWLALCGWITSCLIVADEIASSFQTGDMGPFHVA